MAHHLKQYKDAKACPGCVPVARIEGMVEVLLMERGIDPKRAVSRNPGKVDHNYIKVYFKGRDAKEMCKWFVGILVGVGTFMGIITLLRGVFGI